MLLTSRRPRAPQRSPLHGRYLVRNRLWRWWLRCADTILSLRRGHDAAVPLPAMPTRILLCVGGHLGDAVLATAVVSDLQRALPGVAIGVASGTWNRAILEGHPKVQWFHGVDHWKLNRAMRSFPRRWLAHWRSRRVAVRQIGAIGYDLAIDLYPYYPNFAPVLAMAGVPRRVGYDSGGYGPLYTAPIPWEPERTVIDDHRALLREALPTVPVSVTFAGLELPRIPAETPLRVREKLGATGLTPRAYVVIHVGAGLSHKQWPVPHWTAIAGEIRARQVAVVLTGAGAAERRTADHIQQDVPTAINAVDRLSWDEFRWILANARVVLSADTVAAHVAAAEGIPSVAIVSGIEPQGRWAVPSPDRILLTHQVPCAPCFRSTGCGEMLCVRGVAPAELLRVVEPYLTGNPR
jgi:ADP-heptose:LPS heptosyltransferase